MLKDIKNKKDYFTKRHGAMKKERESFIAHYKDLQTFIKPRRGRFFTEERNKGKKVHQNIINSAGTQAHQIARAGMYAGIMSPARPWFSLRTFDQDLMEFQPVKIWLDSVEHLLRQIFSTGNLYDMAPVLIGELLLFGTGCMLHVEDFDDVSRFYTITAGSYTIAQNSRYTVDTLVREFEMTTIQMIEEFGEGNVSQKVKDAYNKGNYDTWFPVIQFIEPNPQVDPNKLQFSQFKPYRSKYYEPGAVDKEKFLREAGFDEFPAYCPRWDVTGEDIYGTDCPAMTALGDIKGLQVEEKRKAQAIDKSVNPPLHGPPSLRNVPVSSLPGGLSLYSSSNQQKLAPIYEVRPQLQELRLDMEAVEARINKAFFVDMFLAISNMQGIQPKNQLELSQRNEERLLQLGPTLQRFQRELLDLLIDRTFNQALRANILPEPPEELQGSPLQVEYVSQLAMAQRSIATSNIDRIMGFAGGLMGLGFEEAKYKVDAMQAIDEFAEALGPPPRIIVPDKDAEERIAADREAAARAQQLEQMKTLGSTTKDLAAAQTPEGGNALDSVKEAITAGALEGG